MAQFLHTSTGRDHSPPGGAAGITTEAKRISHPDPRGSVLVNNGVLNQFSIRHWQKRVVVLLVPALISLLTTVAALGGPVKPQALEMYNKAVASMDKGDYAAARQQFSQAVEFDPNNPQMLNNVGVQIRDLGDSSGSLALFKKAIAVSPAATESAWLNVCESYRSEGQLEQSIAASEEFCRLFPKDSRVPYTVDQMKACAEEMSIQAAVRKRGASSDSADDYFDYCTYERISKWSKDSFPLSLSCSV